MLTDHTLPYTSVFSNLRIQKTYVPVYMRGQMSMFLWKQISKRCSDTQLGLERSGWCWKTCLRYTWNCCGRYLSWPW